MSCRSNTLLTLSRILISWRRPSGSDQWSRFVIVTDVTESLRLPLSLNIGPPLNADVRRDVVACDSLASLCGAIAQPAVDIVRNPGVDVGVEPPPSTTFVSTRRPC